MNVEASRKPRRSRFPRTLQRRRRALTNMTSAAPGSELPFPPRPNLRRDRETEHHGCAGEDVKEGFAQAVARGPRGEAGGSVERAGAVRSGNDAHRPSAYRTRSHYNRCMRGWSIPLGRWMGVELRVHAFFPLLAVLCLALSTGDGWGEGSACSWFWWRLSSCAKLPG